jgi:hypothetical protein
MVKTIACAVIELPLKHMGKLSEETFRINISQFTCISLEQL